MPRVSLLHDLLDLLVPRSCCNCGRRLTTGEQGFCASCLLTFPRTRLYPSFEDNPLARLFWGQFPVGRATAFLYHQSKAASSQFIYHLKYNDQPDIGYHIGRLMAQELQPQGFFEGVDFLVPIPLSPRRQRQRGYNQSLEIARGIAEVTALPIARHAVRRQHFNQSQTHLSHAERQENVQGAFVLGPSHWWQRADSIRGRHLLLIDDIITTGATITACAQELMKARPSLISLLAVGYTHQP